MGQYILGGDETTETVTADSGEAESEEFTVQGDDKVYLFVEGDTNTSSLDMQLQSRFEADGTWHDVDGESISGGDVTTSDNNAVVFGPFDVEALELKSRFNFVNQETADTEIKAWIGESKDRG